MCDAYHSSGVQESPSLSSTRWVTGKGNRDDRGVNAQMWQKGMGRCSGIPSVGNLLRHLHSHVLPSGRSAPVCQQLLPDPAQ